MAGLLVAAGMALLGFIVAERREVGVAYRPDSGVLRHDGSSAWLPNVLSIVDFALHAGRLYVVDGRGAAVLRFDRRDDGWHETLRIDARGGGPGELELPFSVAVHEDGRIAVLDGSRLHHFDGDGGLLHTRRLDSPCRTGRGMLAVDGADRLHLATTCVSGSSVGDTVVAVLWRVTDSQPAADGPAPVRLESVATAARFTLDGSWGSSFTTERPLGDGRGQLLFGVGLEPCYAVIVPGADPANRCFAAEPRYASPPPALMEGPGASAPPGLDGPAWRWPRTLPYFHDLLGTAAGDVMLRVFSPDSAVLHLVRPVTGEPRDLMVVPYRGIVGCRGGGCLWRQRDDADGMHVRIVEVAQLAGLAAGTRPDGGS